MYKKNSFLAMILIVALFLSTISIPTFSESNLDLNLESTYSVKVENKVDYSSDMYIQSLLESGVDFEVKDYYYQKIDTEYPNLLQNFDVYKIDNEDYILIDEVIEKNAIPLISLNSQGDVRVREVTYGSTQDIASKSGQLETLISGSILTLIGYSHPIIGFITSLSSLFPYSQEEYGLVSAKTLNQYHYTNVWHEVYDIVGFIPMVITESRRTNVIYSQNVINKHTGKSTNNTKTYQGVYYEYSIYYGQITRNLNQATSMYNAGMRNPEVYHYSTGIVINNTSMLP